MVFKIRAKRTLSVYVWAKYLMEHVHGNDNIIFDGVPRRREEAKILHSAVKFYNWEKPIVINIDVSEEESVLPVRLGVDRPAPSQRQTPFAQVVQIFVFC
jgi:adenylate kinase family enzyme